MYPLLIVVGLIFASCISCGFTLKKTGQTNNNLSLFNIMTIVIILPICIFAIVSLSNYLIVSYTQVPMEAICVQHR